MTGILRLHQLHELHGDPRLRSARSLFTHLGTSSCPDSAAVSDNFRPSPVTEISLGIAGRASHTAAYRRCTPLRPRPQSDSREGRRLTITVYRGRVPTARTRGHMRIGRAALQPSQAMPLAKAISQDRPP